MGCRRIDIMAPGTRTTTAEIAVREALAYRRSPPYKTPYFARGSAPRRQAQVAQLVEHATENRSVGSSTLPLGTIGSSLCLRTHEDF